VFVNQRVTTHILEYVISSDPDLSTLLRPASIYAAGSPATASYSVSKGDVAGRLAAFAAGSVNLLLSTVVAEEGMDVAAANCVVRFDPMVHAVSMVQGRGRARQADSSFLVLSERPDRPAATLVEVEKLQQALASTLQPAPRGDNSALRTAQKNREMNARDVLLKAPSLAALVVYCQKTKVDLQVSFSTASNTGSDTGSDKGSDKGSEKGPNKGGWRCSLTYESELRQLTCQHVGASRRVAKAAAGVELMLMLARDAGVST
jgi:superfamily II DNA/RNA helicase